MHRDSISRAPRSNGARMSDDPESTLPRIKLPEGTVTFTFTDIEGSTDLLKKIKDKYATLLADQRRILRQVFSRWNGKEVDTQGDAFFYSFARASDAVNAAVEAQRALVRHTWPEHVEVRIRMGLHTGEPLVEEEGYVGMDVHRAARIAHVGHGGQVLVSETTASLIRDDLPQDVTLLDLGRHRLKDLKQPEHIRQLVIKGLPHEFPPLRSLEALPLEANIVTGPTRVPAFLEAEQDPVPRPLFLGRENEITRLNDSLDEVVAGKGHIVFICGGPGRGKTALMQAFARSSIDRHTELLVASGECSAFTGAADPYLPFKHIMATLTGDLETRWLRGMLTRKQALHLWETMPKTVQTLMATGPDLINVIVPGGGLLDRSKAALEGGASWIERLAKMCEAERPSPGEFEQKSIFEQYQAVLGRTSQEHALLLILDDLQWADSASIHLLFHLGRQVRGQRIMIIGAYRPEEITLGRKGEPHPLEKGLAELKRLYGDIWIDLGEDHEEDRAFIDAYVDSEPNRLPVNFREALFDHTAGHPLFTIELLRDMQERGDIFLDDKGYWNVESDLDWNVLPARVEGVIEERIGRLGDDLRETLTIASVQGEDFTAQVVGQIQEVSEWMILSRLSSVLEKRHRLVKAQEETKIGETILSIYRFSHALFQQYLYNDLSAGERRLLHGEVARVLERLYVNQTEEIAVQLAHHYSEAKLADKAVHYLLLAGDQARTSYAYKVAIDLYNRALGLLKEQGKNAEAARVLMKLGLSYHAHLDFNHAREAYEDGFKLWQRMGEVPTVASTQRSPHPLRMSGHTPPTLDPTLVYDSASSIIVNQLFSGLVELTSRLDIAPGIAQSWDILEEGRKYIFHLRNDAIWSDGTPVSAMDFEYGWKRVLDPFINSENANLLYDIRGAKAYHQKALSDHSEVGVKAIDETTLEVELEEPKGYFMHLLAHSTHFPIPTHIVRIFGDEWSKHENIVTNGPFNMKKFSPGDQIVLTRNPNYRMPCEGNVQQVEIRLTEDYSDIKRMYESDELDVIRLWGIPPLEINRIRHQLAEEFIMCPGAMTYYIGFNTSIPPFDDVRVRRAFAMSIDKETICRIILQGVVLPATGGFVPPGIPGHSEGIGLPYDPAQARELLAEAGYPGGLGFPNITTSNSAESAPYMDSIQENWKNNLGIEFSWRIHDWSTHLQLVSRNHPQLFDLSWIADYPDPDSFLRGSNLCDITCWQNDTYSDLVERASRASSRVERMHLYREADKILMEAAVILPINYYQELLLVKPWLKKFPVSAFSWLYGKDVILGAH